MMIVTPMSVLTLITLVLLVSVVAGQVVTNLTQQIGGVTITQAAFTIQQYTFTSGPVTTLTDISAMVIAQSAQPTVFLSTTFSANLTAYKLAFTATGSFLLCSSSAYSADPATIITAAGQTVYMAVVTSAQASTYTAAFSQSERVYLSGGLSNQNYALPATKANAIQYISWRFPLQTSNFARGYYSFAATYTTATSSASLSAVNGSVSSYQAALFWNHINFNNANNNSPPPDPTLPPTLQLTPRQAYRDGVFITYDRDQSYPYQSSTYGWYVWALYLPFSVPANALFSLTNVDPPAAAALASDNGGNDFASGNVNVSSSLSGQTSTGQVQSYRITLPPTNGSVVSYNVTLISLAASNNDLFAVNSSLFVGALGGPTGITLNPITGAVVENGNGYAQGNNLGTNAYFVNTSVAGYDYSSTSETSIDTISIIYSSFINVFYHILIFGHIGGNYTLSVSSSIVPIIPILNSSGITTTIKQDSIQYYLYPIPGIDNMTTDLSLVFLSASSTTSQAIAYASLTSATASSSPLNVTGIGSGQLHSANSSGAFTAVISLQNTGFNLLIAVDGTGLTANTAYTLSVSITQRILLSGLTNQSVNIPALAANSIQYITWSFPTETTGALRGYYSFIASYSTNATLNALAAGNISTLAAQSVAPPQPVLIWNHINFGENNNSIPDPTLPATFLLQPNTSVYSSGVFITYDRDQSYPSIFTIPLTTSYYTWALFIPFTVPTTSVFSLNNVDPISQVQTATDAGGDDLLRQSLLIPALVETNALRASQVIIYEFVLPAFQTVAINVTSLTGNVDLFLVRKSLLVGATGTYGININSTTGAIIENSNGFFQGNNLATNAYYNTILAPTYDESSTNDDTTGVDVLTLNSSSTSSVFYDLLVFAQRDSTYTLNTTTLTFPAVTSGTVNGDPSFQGFRGQRYQIHGIDGQVYNIITTPKMQFNVRFKFLNGPRICPIMPSTRRPSNGCWSHPGSYMSELGIQTRNHRIYLQAGDAATGFATVTIDGRRLTATDDVLMIEDENGHEMLLLNNSHQIVINSPPFEIVCENIDGFLNLQTVTVTSPKSLYQSHGLLGQTHRVTSTSTRPIEGSVDDYRIDEDCVFGHSFVYNRFESNIEMHI